MNKIFKVIWSKAQACFVVVSENASAVGGKKCSVNKKSAVGKLKNFTALLAPAVVSLVVSSAAVGLTGQAAAGEIDDSPAPATTHNVVLAGGKIGLGSSNLSIRSRDLTDTTRKSEMSIGIGTGARVGDPSYNSFHNQGIAIGMGGKETGGTWAKGTQSIAIGGDTQALGHSSIAIGGDDVDQSNRVNITYNLEKWNAATNQYDSTPHTKSIDQAFQDLTKSSLGPGAYKNTISGHYSIALGIKSQAAKEISVALGTSATASELNTVALGAGATANVINSVAIGGGSTTDESFGKNQTGTTLNGLTYTWAGGTSIDKGDVVSFGRQGYERQLKNVGAGEVSETSTDAINGSQLYAIAKEITGRAVSYVHVNTGEEGQSEGEANTNKGYIDEKAGATGNLSATLGVNAKASAESAIAIGSGANASQAHSIALGSNSTTSAVSLTANSADTDKKLKLKDNDGDAKNLIFSGLESNQPSPVGVVSVGSDTQLRQIQGVAPGKVARGSFDAVNGDQLYLVATYTGFNLQEKGVNKARVNNNNEVNFTDGNFSTVTITPKETTETGGANATIKFDVVTEDIPSTTAASAITPPPPANANAATPAGLAKTADVIRAINHSGFTLKSSANTTGSAVTNGGSVTVNKGSSNNITIAQSGSTLTIDTAENVNFTSVTASGTIGVTNGPSLSTTGINANNKNISNVAAGTENHHAVNFAQLTATNNNVTTAQNKANAAQTAATAAQNTANTAVNKADAAQQTANTAVSKADTAQQTADAAKTKAEQNATAIAVNTTNIATNTQNIGKNTEAIEENKGKIATNTTNIAANAANIAKGLLVASSKTGTGTNTDSGEEKLALGDKITLTAGDNIDITRNGGTFTIKTSATPTFSSVTTDTLTIKDGPVLSASGLDMKDQKITNVAAGTLEENGKDAVNAGQLFNVKQTADTAKSKSDENATNIGKNTTAIEANKTSIDNNAENIAKGLLVASSKTGTGTNTDEGEEKLALGDKITLTAGDNIDITRNGGTFTIKTSATPTFTSLSITDGPTLSSTGLAMNNQKITGLAKGDVSEDSSDAVTGGQLYEVKQAAAKANKGWKLKASAVQDSGELDTGHEEAEETISPDELVEFIASKNLKIKRVGNKITLSTKDNVTFTDITTDNATINTKLNAENATTTLGTTTIGGENKTFSIASKTETNFGGVVLKNVGKGVSDTDVANMQNLKDFTNDLTARGFTVQGNVGTTPPGGTMGANQFVNPLGGVLPIVGGAAADSTVTFSSNNLRTRVEIENVPDPANQGQTKPQGKVVIEMSEQPTFKKVTSDTVDAQNINLQQGGTLDASKGTTNLGDTNVAEGKTFDNTKGTTNLGDTTIAENKTFDATNATTNLGNTTIGGEGKTFSVAAKTTTDFNGNVLNNIGEGEIAENSKTAINGGKLYKELDKGLNFKGNEGDAVKRKLGDTLLIVGADESDRTPGDYSSKNVKTKSSVSEDGTAKVEIQLADSPEFKSLKTTEGAEIGGNLSVTGNSNLANLTATGDTTLGGEGKSFTVNKGTTVNMGGNTITNVGSGEITETSTDAVNGSDVFNKLKELKKELTDNALSFAGNAPTTAGSENKYIQNLHAGPMEIVGGGTAENDQYGAANIKTITTDKGIEIRIANNPNFSGKVTAGSVETGDLTATGDTTLGGTGKNLNVAAGTTINMGDNKITGVKAGEVSANSKEAVNGAQLYALQESPLTFTGNDGSTARKLGESLEILGAGSTDGTYSSANIKTEATTGKIEIKLADKPTFKGLSAGGKITDVEDGEISPDSKDAVNGRQIFALVGPNKAPEIANTIETTITKEDGSTETIVSKNVVVEGSGDDTKPALTTYNVQNQKEHVTNSVITAIKHMNTQGIKFFHTNDGTDKTKRPTDQAENIEDSSAGGAYATAIGYRANAAGENSVAFGAGAIAGKKITETRTGADGVEREVTRFEGAKNAIAIGNDAVAANENTIAIGTGNQVTGRNSGAIGDPSEIHGNNSYSLGNNNTIAAGKDNVFVVGNEVTNVESNSIFLGNKSGYVAAAGEKTSTQGKGAYENYKKGKTTYEFAGGKTAEVVGVVSVGGMQEDGTLETRRIQNVAPGLLSAESTDVINGSQLYAVMEQGWSLTTGTVEGSVNSKHTNLNGNESKISLGSLVTINAGNNIEVEHDSKERSVSIATSMRPVFNELTINPQGKIDLGGNRIQNVGKAVAPTDAVNYGQFKAELGQIDRDLRAGIAGATAMAFLQRSVEPGRSLVSVAVGGYRGEHAIAVGYARNADNNRVSIKVGVGMDTRKQINYGGSIGYQW